MDRRRNVFDWIIEFFIWVIVFVVIGLFAVPLAIMRMKS